jgi:signal transduction histidine kinase
MALTITILWVSRDIPSKWSLPGWVDVQLVHNLADLRTKLKPHNQPFGIIAIIRISHDLLGKRLEEMVTLVSSLRNAHCFLWDPAGLLRKRYKLAGDKVTLISSGLDLVKAEVDTFCIKLEGLWSEAAIAQIIQEYEGSYAVGVLDAATLTTFADKLRLLLGATYLQLYLIHEVAGSYEPELGSSTAFAPKSASVINDRLLFRAIPSTFDISGPSYAGIGPFSNFAPTIDTARIVTTFEMAGRRGFVVYSWASPQLHNGLFAVCNTASRELMHLLRVKDLRSYYGFLRSLAEIEDLHQGKQHILAAAVGRLKDYFGCSGASIVELLRDDSGTMNLQKTFTHNQRSSQVIFNVASGLAYQCIRMRSALLITDTRREPPFLGMGREFDPEMLELSTSKPLNISPIVAPDTPPSENERSLIYFPLTFKGNVIGAVKLGDFNKANAFDLHDLRHLSRFTRAIGTFLGNVRSIDNRIEMMETQKRMMEQASSLFFYREVTLGIFHQVGNDLDEGSTSLLLADSLSSKWQGNQQQIGELIKRSKMVLDHSKALILRAQGRGRKIEPVLEERLLIAEIVRPVVETAKLAAKDPGIIRHSYRFEDYRVNVDRDLLIESFTNIINNALWAVKANPSARAKRILIGVRGPDEEQVVRIEVRDSGVGIQPQVFPRLFEPFFTTHPRGTGLGLYFARQVVRHFGGDVSIPRSKPGKGTVVRISLPRIGAPIVRTEG